MPKQEQSGPEIMLNSRCESLQKPEKYEACLKLKKNTAMSEITQISITCTSEQFTRGGNSNTFRGNFYLRIIESKIQVSAG